MSKVKEMKIGNYEIIFEKLSELRSDNDVDMVIDLEDQPILDDSIEELKAIKEDIELSSYTFFTRT